MIALGYRMSEPRAASERDGQVPFGPISAQGRPGRWARWWAGAEPWRPERRRFQETGEITTRRRPQLKWNVLRGHPIMCSRFNALTTHAASLSLPTRAPEYPRLPLAAPTDVSEADNELSAWLCKMCSVRYAF